MAINTKKKWYKTTWGIILLLVIFYPAGLFFMWRNTKWHKKVKWGITAFYALFFLFQYAVISSARHYKAPPQQEAVKEVSKTVQPTNTPSPIKSPVVVVKATAPTKAPTPTKVPEKKKEAKKIIEKINNLVAEKYPDFEVTIWNKNSDFASEGQVPYEVVLNGSFNKTASSCDAAKKTAYYMLEALYKDNEIRPTLSRVLITFPYYLRISWGASDGVPMAENGSFSGPTNFWTVIEKVGLGEDESGEMKNRSWATYLTRCE